MVERRKWSAGRAVVLVGALLLAGCTDADGGGGASSSRRDAPGEVERRVPTRKATGEFATDLDLKVDPDQETTDASFEVHPGTEEATVTGLDPRQRVSLVDADGNRLIVLRADTFGQVQFSYLPDELAEFQTGARAKLPTSEGYPVQSGRGYTVRADDTDPVEVSEPFDIASRDEHPDPEIYEAQSGEIGPSGDETEWFGYITTRDGVRLSANIKLPGPADEGPYPTVVEYSGYGPSNPAATEPGSLIAGLLGYATVGVNMRGTGCSGGVFDVFNASQQVDGYDVIEAVARQPWVKGAKVGMVGLSYSGITQLYVAATQPPSLAAVTPLSVIKDPWLQQWPGGVYNSGFTKNWLQERDRESSATGTTWVAKRIAEGDETCAAHQELREQNIDFESFGRSLERRPDAANARDLSKLVSKIEVPVYLTGAWQDEQTGPQFADMLGNFTSAPVRRFTLFNGRHPDGYTPLVLTRWYEFLELYVDGQVPRLSEGVRGAAPNYLGSTFGDLDGLGFEPDRFAEYGDDDYDEVRKAYEAEPEVRVLFEAGAGASKPGSPVATFEQSYTAWPPPRTRARSYYLGDGTLEADAPADGGVHRFENDPSAGEVDFFGQKGYELLAPVWDFDWTTFEEGKGLSYLSSPFRRAQVLGGPGHAELFVRVPDGDAAVQVSVSVVRPDGVEWLVTSGLLRLSDRKVDEERSTELFVERTYAEEDAEPMPADRFEPVKVALPSFAQPVRPGDRVRITISSPGRDFGAWRFETIGEPGTPRDVAFGADQPSRVVLGVLPDIAEVPGATIPCPSLRGQACRPYRPVPNRDA